MATPPRSPSPSSHTRTPLPLSIRDEILSYLIPPRPPLPLELLSRDFIERLTFLPPDPLDIDAQLSPYPSPEPNALSEALTSCELSPPTPTQYRYDGSTMLARTLVQPSAYLDKKVEVSFESEQERGWVYRGAKFSIGGDDDEWYEDVETVPTQPAEPEDEVKAYWAGWTPTTSDTEASQEQEDEDAYWAQYGAGPDTSAQEEAYRAPSPPPLSPPVPAETLAKEPNPSVSDKAAASSSPVGSPKPSHLEEKLVAKIKCQLLKAWTQFSASQDPEAAVIAYLRICREVNNRPSWGFVSTDAAADDEGIYGDVKEEVLRTRVESVRDIFEVLGKLKDEFWRWCEEAIRVRSVQAQEGPEDIEGC